METERREKIKGKKMSDPKIKLFGKTIELPEVSEAAEMCEPAQTCHENSSNQKLACSSNCSVLEDSSFIGDDDVGDHKSQQSQSGPKQDDADDENQSHPAPPKELKDSNSSPPQADNSKQGLSDSNNSQDKTLKKPDKILPCPRCNSMDTKFCYFNNYNMNQPRHFCKNCQRYWTAGGTMRNVPVGAGRRKNKTSQFRPLASNPDGSLLAFNSEVPLCESMVSVLNIRSKENGDDRSSESLILSSKDEAGKKKIGFREFMPNCHHPFPSQVPIFRGAHWAYPIPMPFYSTMPHYWVGPGGVWKVPFVTPPTPAPSSDPNFPTLGKHSRDENILEPAHSEKCLWVPKTLRIDDPGGAAKSSIWSTTLGINNDRDDDDSVVGVGVGVGGGLFKAFQSQSKDDEKSPIQETSTVLQANPAALSRSVSFHESS